MIKPFCALALAFLAALAPVRAAERLNFIFILIDDMGVTDAGCYGSKFYETPQIDRLARDGVKFTAAYSACTVCSPTRAALLTGKYPARLHLTDWIPGHVSAKAKLRVPEWQMALKREWTTLPALLRAAGYATASIGKWHLGDAPPTAFGFDVNIGGTAKGQPPAYFAPYKIPTLPEGPDGEFLTDRLTAETEKFIEQNKERPFFIYLPHFAVHTPIAGKKEVIAKYRAKRDESAPHKNAVYAALVESVDDSVGRIRAKLDELKIADRTVIVFTSDNGGLIGPTSNLGIRVGKGSAYEGGVRVPAIALVPGLTRAGAESATPIITHDWFPTILDLAGVAAPAAADGVSLAPILRGGAIESRPLFWHYPHYHPGGATPYSSVRDAGWKLLHFYENERVELYDLAADPAEQRDLATENPAKTAELRAKLDAWRKAVEAQTPTVNPQPNP